jgi:hypothetical protein
MLCSLCTNLIAFEVQCGECLSKIVRKWLSKKKAGKSGVTLFCCRASARYCTP